MKLGFWYLIIVAIIATAVALFEIWGIAHYRLGWGEPLPQDKVWGKSLIRKAPFNLVGFQLLTRYHFFMYCVLVPASASPLAFYCGTLLRLHPPIGSDGCFSPLRELWELWCWRTSSSSFSVPCSGHRTRMPLHVCFGERLVGIHRKLAFWDYSNCPPRMCGCHRLLHCYSGFWRA